MMNRRGPNLAIAAVLAGAAHQWMVFSELVVKLSLVDSGSWAGLQLLAAHRAAFDTVVAIMIWYLIPGAARAVIGGMNLVLFLRRQAADAVDRGYEAGVSALVRCLDRLLRWLQDRR
jgi:hypothetical protein